MAAGKQKMASAPHPPPPAVATVETQSRKSKKKKRAAARARRDDVDALAPSDTLDFGTLPAPDEGLAEAIAAVLEAPRAAANGGGAGGHSLGVAGADATAAAQAELLATANELYQRMDAGGGGLRPDGAYWAALPAHIRNFVRNASLSPPLRAAGGNERAKAQAMYAIAQQMAQTGEQGQVGDGDDGDDVSEGKTGVFAGGWQGEMSLPVDPSFFGDAEFTAALEQQGEKSAIIGVGVGVAEVREGEGGDDEEAEWMPAAGKERLRGRSRSRDIPTRDGSLVTSSVLTDFLPKAEAAAAAAAAAATAPISPLNMPKQPSSRAQGKQPMNYPPPPPAATMTTTSTTTSTTAQQKSTAPSPTTRSSRAASKAPLQPHAYPHSHSHHHPSPPSSNASQPQKHRPSSTQAPSSRNNPNAINKIWSTSSTEERERIKEFWLGLGEQDRRNLVKLEKEAVLKKMKEQQRHSCACAVCGRKRCVYHCHLHFFFWPDH